MNRIIKKSLCYSKHSQSTDKPTFKKAISQNAQIIVKQYMFALAKRGAGATPLQKERCPPEDTSADVWCPKDLVPPPFTRAARCLYEEI